MNIASLLAARDLRQRPLRTSLTILSVALGVATILGVSITNESTTGSFRTMVDTVIGKADFWVEGPTDLFGTDALARIQNVAGVRTAAPALQTQGRLRNKKDSSLDILGIEPSLDRRIRSYRLAEGRFLANEERAEIVLVKSFARRHDINRGDKVVLLTHRQPLTLRVVGILEKEGAGNLADGRTGFLHIGRTQKLLGVGNMMSYASVQVADAEDADETRELVQGELGSSYRAIQPEQRVEAFDQVLSGIRTGLSFFSGIAVFVGAFLIYNTFSMIALERIRELGILRALGLSRRQAVGLVLREAAIVGVAGSVIGALLGIAVARILLESTAQMVNTPLESFIVPSSGLLLSFIVGLAITLIAALQPAWTAGRVSPLGAVTLRAQSQRGWAERLGWIPGSLSIFLGFLLMQNLVAIVQSETIRQIGAFLIMLGASLFLPVLVPQLVRVFGRLTFLLSVSFRMGVRNMQRNPVRASTTVGAIMIALAMILSVGGMNVSFKKEVGRWVDQSIGADAVVASGAP
ncbi:MAG: FtsX-like permease family protein, partial [Terriglobia bacterium]